MAEEAENNLESIIEISESTTNWNDIGGCIEAKKELQRLSIEIMNPDVNKRWGGKPPKGILLYGPEGTGKTLLAKAFSSSTDAELWKIKGADIGSKFVNESANNVKRLFESAKDRVEEGQQVILFIDEFDSLARRRGYGLGSGSQEDAKVVNAFNVYLDGLESVDGIYVIASTNRIDILDPSIIRPGRFDRHIEVGNPNYEERKEIYEIHVNKIEEEASINAFEEINYELLSKESEGYSGAKIAEIVKRARDAKKWEEYETGKEASKISTEDILNEVYKEIIPSNKKFGFASGVIKDEENNPN